MITTPTVLVVGAGASIPYGFPSGHNMVSKVLDTLKAPNGDAWRILSNNGTEEEISREIERFHERLAHTYPASVDDFLDDAQTSEVEVRIATTAIATCLLGKDFLPTLRDRELEDHWLGLLWQKMKGRRINDFKSNRVHIVTYNYDLLIECFFQEVLAAQYRIAQDEALTLFQKVTHITHVHGDLGDLPCARGRPYSNGRASFSEVSAAAQHLSLLHMPDRTRHEKPYSKSYGLIGNATRLLFMGFGYHHENVRRLNIRHAWRPDFQEHTIAGSTFGLTDRELHTLREEFRSELDGLTFEGHRLKAHDFLRECL
jgi:hypothetical protein